MNSFPGSPRLIKGGIVLVNPTTGAIQGIITLQYNPAELTRSVKGSWAEQNSEGRQDPLRMIGPPVETIRLVAELDVADQLAAPVLNPDTVLNGLHPQLAALETLLYPPSRQLQLRHEMAQLGRLEITPVESPLTLFVWNHNRTVPVRINDLSITEEAFDPLLNPLRAKVTLDMQVLNVNDLGYNSKGGSLFMVYQRRKEQLSQTNLFSLVRNPGIGGIL